LFQGSKIVSTIDVISTKHWNLEIKVTHSLIVFNENKVAKTLGWVQQFDVIYKQVSFTSITQNKQNLCINDNWRQNTYRFITNPHKFHHGPYHIISIISLSYIFCTTFIGNHNEKENFMEFSNFNSKIEKFSIF